MPTSTVIGGKPQRGADPLIAIVLPHRESFGPHSAGAVAMVVQRLAAGPSRHRCVVVGPPVRGPAYPGIAYRPVPVPRWLPLSVTQSYALMLADTLARERPDLIEVHNKPDVATWLAWRFPSRPVTLHLHNDPRTMRGARSPRARRGLLDRLAGVTAVSQFISDAFMDGVRHGSAPVVIHNALDLAALPRPVPPGLRAPTILFAGRVVPDKAPDAFIAACALALPRLPGWRAEIIGADGFSVERENSKFIQGLRPAAAAAGVSLLGFREHAKVLAAMAQVAIVVVPSRWPEPFGMTALEAMACGAALACSARGGLAEVVGEACMRIDPDDPAGFAEKLSQLASDAELRAALSRAGRERVQEHFDISVAVARLDDVRGRIFGRQSRQDGTSPSPLPSGRCM